MTSAEIKQLQSDLKKLGYDPGAVDGIRTVRTINAIRSFQSEHGLRVDGIAGPWTLEHLRIALEEMEQTRPVGDDPQLPFLPPLLDGGFLRDLVRSQGHTWTTRWDFINLVGVRGWAGGQQVENLFNEYNDMIYMVIGGAVRAVEAFQATVDPGRLREPNPHGVAHLAPGHYLYKSGIHRGREKALVQARPVTVLRYFDEDPERMTPMREDGWFGINIHRGGTSASVGPWSAGCQVIHGSVWPRFLELIGRAESAGQRLFRYTLLESETIEALLRS